MCFCEFEDRYFLNESVEVIVEMFEELFEGIECIVEIVKVFCSFLYLSVGKCSVVSLVEVVNFVVKLIVNLYKYKNSVNFIVFFYDV